MNMIGYLATRLHKGEAPERHCLVFHPFLAPKSHPFQSGQATLVALKLPSTGAGILALYTPSFTRRWISQASCRFLPGIRSPDSNPGGRSLMGFLRVPKLTLKKKKKA